MPIVLQPPNWSNLGFSTRVFAATFKKKGDLDILDLIENDSNFLECIITDDKF